jgi:hypothetical protein
MNAVLTHSPEPGRTGRYAQIVRLSKKSEWQIDRDVLGNREFDFNRNFLPAGLSRVDTIPFLNSRDQRLLSQVQGRTYAYIFGLVERFISAKMLDQGRAHALDDQNALEALVRFTNDEIKHQELFRRVEEMIADKMPLGYRQMANPSDVARAVLAASTWAVLALTCHIELFVQSHYVESIVTTANLCPLFSDVFRYHWKDESQHVVLDELEWKDEHERLAPAQRDRAVDDLIALVGAVDGILQAQSAADSEYFARIASREFSNVEVAEIRRAVLGAYRWQYIVTGVRHPHFGKLLTSMTTPAQMARIQEALAPILAAS